MTWDIVGIANNYMRPIFAAQINYAAGPATGQGALDLLCVGMRSSAGNLVVDQEIRQVLTATDCRVAAGTGSQLSRMGISALRAIAKYGGNINVWLAACTEATGTQALVTMVLGGTANTVGTLVLTIAGVAIQVSISAADTLNTIGTNVAAAINGTVDCPFTASWNNGTSTVTLTCINKGLQGLNWIVYQDLSSAPSSLTSTITGSATVNTSGQVTGVRAGATGSGTGTESYTAIITKLGSKRWARIASGANDATNAASLLAFGQAQAAASVMNYDQFIYGHNGTQSAATTLGQTTLNDPRSEVVAMRNSETHPSELAAGFAAVRAAVESADFTAVTQGIGPIPDYDNYNCSAWIAPQRTQFSDTWLPTEENALLNAGVTPISTYNSVATLVRGITTYCLLSGQQDTRCLDLGDAVFPDFAVLDLQLLYTQVFRQANHLVQDNNPPQIPEPKSGVAYPALWESKVRARMSDWRDAGCIPDTFSGTNPQLPVKAIYNKVARRIQSNAPFVVNRVQHQLLQTVAQTAPS